MRRGLKGEFIYAMNDGCLKVLERKGIAKMSEIKIKLPAAGSFIVCNGVIERWRRAVAEYDAANTTLNENNEPAFVIQD